MNVTITGYGPAAKAAMPGGIHSGSMVLDHDQKLAFPLSAPPAMTKQSWDAKWEEDRADFLGLAIPWPGLYEAAMQDLSNETPEP